MNAILESLVFRKAALKTIEKLQENIRTVEPTGYGSMNNTGTALNSLRYKWLDKKTISIYSDMPDRDFNYIMTLETGRKPGKWPPRESILKWINERGITPSGISKDSLAFLIARKIESEGSLVYRKGGNTGIISEVQSERWITENFLRPLEKGLKKIIQEEFKTF